MTNRPQDTTTNPDFNEAFDAFQKRIKTDEQFNVWQTALSVWIIHWVNFVPLAFLLGYFLAGPSQAGFGVQLFLAIFAAGQVFWTWAGLKQIGKIHKALTGRSIGEASAS